MSESPPPPSRTCADALAEVPGVVAVVLGGSWARGAADAHSDVDLGIYYEPARPPSIDALRGVARTLDPGGELSDYGEWGPWVNGGGWLTIEGRPVDWLYRDLARLRDVIADCLAGRPTCEYTLGHPHGFHNTYYLAELHHCVPLHDPRGVVEDLRASLVRYPAELRQAIVERYLYDAGFTLDGAWKNAARADVLHAAGSLFRVAACLVQVLFALNERWLMNEKGALAQIAAGELARVPAGFDRRVREVLTSPGGDADTLRRSCLSMRELLDETRALAPPLRYAWEPPPRP